MNQNNQQPGSADELNGGMHASIFVKVWGNAGGGDAGRIALADYAYKLGQRDAIAASRRAAGGEVRKLKWTEPAKPNKECSYDHVTAQTPFGPILITWKGWKEFSDPTVDEHPVTGFVGHSAIDLEDAKRDAEIAYFDAIDASTPAVASLPDVAMPEQIEAAAKAIYEQLPTYQGGNATTHPWQPGGNSNKQDEARRYARAALKALAAQPAEGSAQVATDCGNCFEGKTEFDHVCLVCKGSVIAAEGATQAGDVLTNAARDVLAERRRQVEQEGWSPERDDKYLNCELARAAATYAVCSHIDQLMLVGQRAWPWHPEWFKRTTYRRDLTKAGTLILAEIERLDRDRARIDGDKQGDR